MFVYRLSEYLFIVFSMMVRGRGAKLASSAAKLASTDD
jgi:hypothetical protein